MGLKVREAIQSDFDGVFKLLKRLNDTSLSKNDWKKITLIDFNSEASHYGYVLEGDGELLGFLGTIFYKRQFNAKEVNFCNIHSWIVDPKAKTGGMALLLRVLKLKDHVITNFTASEGPYKIFQSLKFKEVSFKNFKLFPLQSATSHSKFTVRKITNTNAEKLLDQNELQLYKDHRGFENVQFLTVSNNETTSFVISKKKPYNPRILQRIPFAKNLLKNKLFLGQIHYISYPEVLFTGFSNTLTAIKIAES